MVRVRVQLADSPPDPVLGALYLTSENPVTQWMKIQLLQKKITCVYI